ncbi:MAG TPA: hypothetical protein VL490_05040 [Mucilaginibacter sp.]|jgi:hypothetical protein|nr:hypothetical protein [Mucilaginibacter sp.]
MKYYIAFLLTFSFSHCFAQKEIFVDSAFYYFHHANYPRAIKAYKELIAKTHYSYQMEMLALCYERTDSVEQEKAILEKAINAKDGLSMGITARCSWTLADIYLREKNYQKALSLYDVYEEKFKHSRMPDINRLAHNLDRENARSKCFEALNMTDSAVNILTPYIFCTYRNLRHLFSFFDPNDPANLRDSLHHDSVCARYLTLLKKLHNNRDIKAALKKADADFVYKESLEYSQNDNFLTKNVNCSFYFYGIKINYCDFGESDLKEKLLAETSQNPVFTKAYHLEKLRQLPLYKMIMALPD